MENERGSEIDTHLLFNRNREAQIKKKEQIRCSFTTICQQQALFQLVLFHLKKLNRLLVSRILVQITIIYKGVMTSIRKKTE